MSNPDLTVIIPVYNEKETILALLERVRAVEIPKQIILVDDGSSDGTREILGQLDLPGVLVIMHDRNRGKGAAIRTALSQVRGRMVIIQDADLEYDPQDYHLLVQTLERSGGPVVYGSRLLRRNPISSPMFYLGGRTVTFFTNLLFGSRLTDVPTCYKLFTRELITSLPLRCEAFEFCPEVTALILRRGINIPEVPISYHPRSTAEGKKIGVVDGVQAIWTLLRLRLGL